ncbi:MAG: ATP-binding cassette domain-containing protein [Lachnospiraceae bacterium]|nr:ATP-binding cassette domain-containing protein [Lachnospiraceae bacterium]
MKTETLRMERVTYKEQGNVCLDNFSMTIRTGEVFGLVPVNHYGLNSLLKLLKQNLPLHYGYVYYREKLVNQWKRHQNTTNRISVIQSKSCLAEDLSVADNIFVLRAGFKKWLIKPQVLQKQLQPFLEEIGMKIDANAYIDELSAFECFVVELLKAVVSGNRLIVLVDISTFISESELVKLHEIIRYYAGKGISFLYITAHFEEAKQRCDKTALMVNGQIIKCFETRENIPDTFSLESVEDYDRWVRQQLSATEENQNRQAVFETSRLYYGSMRDLNIRVFPGECMVLQDLDNKIFKDLIALFQGEKPDSGQILLQGNVFSSCEDRRIAIIQELPTESMLFPRMSYMDNLCFNMDHRFKRVWTTGGIRKSIINEYGDLLGKEVFQCKVEKLSQKQKYDLVYTRILLQNPKVVFCVQPFKSAEVSIRSHIWELLERFLDRNIAVVILAVNLADSLALADKLIRIKHGKVQEIYDKEEFIKLPVNTPWLYLYQEKYAKNE